jgi:G:T-mismatch repair DNA endonuclease (very short patch repair protein)
MTLVLLGLFSIDLEIKKIFFFQNFILTSFLKIGLIPDVVRNGRRILLLEIKELQLKFITINSYLEGNEFQIAEQFGIKFSKHFFPLHFNKDVNYNYKGSVPNINYFLMFNDNIQLKNEKEVFVKTLTDKNYVWQFEKELVRFCDEKLWLLTLSCLKFVQECFNFQCNLKKNLKVEQNILVHPFAHQLCSLPGFVYKVFRIFYLNKEDIYSIRHEFGSPSRTVSKSEYEWASYLEFLHPDKNFVSAFNNPKGQKFFKEAIPDLYSAETGEAIFFHGCYYHGHFENCKILPQATGKTRNAFFNKTYEELNKEFDQKAFFLKRNHPNEIKEVKIMWECTYQTQKKESQIFSYFINNIFKPHPLYRLCPRTCIRGAFLDVYALKWTQSQNLDESFMCYDVNGLYSYCAIKFPYMTGKYEVLMGKKLQSIQITNFQLTFENKPMFGTMLVTILPPKTLFYPFLLYRLQNGKTVNTLCVQCAENNKKNFCFKIM